jgi:cytochrome c553
MKQLTVLRSLTVALAASVTAPVAGMMPADDIRSNYFLSGCTWTIRGVAPNLTMETFVQGSDNTSNQFGTNCFSCHVSNGTSVGHVFPALKGLFQGPQAWGSEGGRATDIARPPPFG